MSQATDHAQERSTHDTSTWPTPLAYIHQRVKNSPSRNYGDRFDSSLHLAEASIKLTTICALAVLSVHNEKKSFKYQHTLIRANSLGSWAGELRRIAQDLHRTPNIQAKQIARRLTQKENVSNSSAPTLHKLAQKLCGMLIWSLRETAYEGLNRSRANVLDFFQDLIHIRNRTQGHGAKTWVYYKKNCEAMAELSEITTALISPMIDLAVVDEPPAEKGGYYTLLRLSGLQQTRISLPFDDLVADQGDLVLIGKDKAMRIPPLIEVNPSTHDTFFSNGSWNSTSSRSQFINYFNGDTLHLHRPSLGIAPAKDIASHTAALQELVASDNLLHNLPNLITTYIRRSTLEDRLTALLSDRMHRVISIRGPGGAGKTTLALKIAHDFSQSIRKSKFDAIIWFSSRDVDLLTTGPRPVHQDVTDLTSIVHAFAGLVSSEEISDSHDCLEYMRRELDPDLSGTTYLIVLDNVETLESPDSVHRFLDANIILPSKLLTTTRHQTFMGDFPLTIPEMGQGEAHSLIRSEARRLHAEPQFDDHTCDRIIHLTGGLPYALTLATAHVSAGNDLNSLSQTLGKTETLSALFDRSVEALDEDAIYLYMLLGKINKPIVSHALKAILEVNGRKFEDALEQLEYYSLATMSSHDTHRSVSLTQMAYAHSRAYSIAHPDEIHLDDLARKIRGWSAPRAYMTPVFSFFRNLLDEIEHLPLSERKTVISIAEHASQDYPELALQVALEKSRLSYPVHETRGSFRNAARLSYEDERVWIEWSLFERKEGNSYQSLVTAIRAIESGYSDPLFSSNTAAELADYLSNNKDSIPSERRGSFLVSVRNDMQKHRENGLLSATDLSRLGWLYLLQASPHDQALIAIANQLAQEGLTIEPNNQYCMSLHERTSY